MQPSQADNKVNLDMALDDEDDEDDEALDEE